MKVIAFFNVKGGVGKTSSATNVSYILAAIHNKRTLLVDLDPQSNATDFFNCYGTTEWTVENVLKGKGRNAQGVEVSVQPADVVVHTEYKNLDIMPASFALGRCEKELVADISTPQQFRLKTALTALKDFYDYVVLDCSPSAESLVNTNGLAVADFVFSPMKCDKWATRGLNATIEVIDTIATYNFNLTFGGCFFCQWENRNVNKQIYNELTEALHDKMFDVKIRKNKSVEEVSYTNKPLLLYDKNGTATQDYIALTQKIINIVNK